MASAPTIAPGSLSAAARRSRSSLTVGQSLPVIVEDDDSLPDVTGRSHRRPFFPYLPGTRSPLSLPYSVGWPSTAVAPSRERDVAEEDIEKYVLLRKRRRFYRLALSAIILVAVVVGLAVGVPLGLRRASATNAPASPVPGNLFPAGSYSFTTALTGVTTGCTSNSATFRCFPFSVYSPNSPLTSSATFSWSIVPLTSYSYSISSSTNPFAPYFSGVPLVLLDANQYSERLVFNVTMAKSVVASAPLDPSDMKAATCWFNSTTLSATLWTKIRADYPAIITATPGPEAAGDQFAPWPYQVEISQVQDGGQGVPTCIDADGASVGHGLGASGRCGCYYANFDLQNGTTSQTPRDQWSAD